MEYAIGGCAVGLWLSIGFGTRAVFKAAKHGAWDFPLLPVVWPLILLIAAYAPNWFKDA